MRLFAFVITLLGFSSCLAAVNAIDGSIKILGVTLLEDSEQSGHYRYLPPYPRLAIREDDRLAFSFFRYSSEKRDQSGATLNAMLDLTLTEERLEAIKKELVKIEPGAILVGPVEFVDPADNPEAEEAATSTYRVISATIGKSGVDQLEQGKAPIGSGAKLPISITFDSEAATLLWAYFQRGAHTDIAVEIETAYLAQVDAFDAVVEADMETLYSHFSKIKNQQSGVKRDYIRQNTDSLIQEQILKISSSNGGAAFDINGDLHEKLLETVTTKLIDVMFDTEKGWSKPIAAEAADIGAANPGRVKGGTVSGGMLGVALFGGDVSVREHTDYIPDDQHILRDRTEIRTNKFRLDLSRKQLIRKPHRMMGNIGGLYAAYGEDPLYFGFVDLDEAASTDVQFTLDPSYKTAFLSLIDSVIVDVTHNGTTESRQLAATEILEGRYQFEPIGIKKKSASGNDWKTYNYRIRWNLRGSSSPLIIPRDGTLLTESLINPEIKPPFGKTKLQIYLDDSLSAEMPGHRVVSVDLMARISGEAKVITSQQFDLASLDTGPKTVTIFHDEASPIFYREKYLGSAEELSTPPKRVSNGLVFIAAPKERGVRP